MARAASTYDVLVGNSGPAHFPNFQYVIADPRTGHAVVIDPAWDSTSIAERIVTAGYSLQAVVLTHAHSDHVNGVAELVDLLPAPVYMSRDEADFSGADLPGLTYCADGEALSAGSVEIRVMQTPGHTVGSCCFRVEDRLFAGDTLFPEGVGFTHYPGGSATDLFDSTRRLNDEMSDGTRLYSGHRYRRGPGLSFAELRRINAYLRLSRREDFVAFATRRTEAMSHDRLLTGAPVTDPLIKALVWDDGEGCCR